LAEASEFLSLREAPAEEFAPGALTTAVAFDYWRGATVVREVIISLSTPDFPYHRLLALGLLLRMPGFQAEQRLP
jgi:hypothetical protein